MQDKWRTRRRARRQKAHWARFFGAQFVAAARRRSAAAPIRECDPANESRFAARSDPPISPMLYSENRFPLLRNMR
jgi:hypothetical protein